MYYRRMFLLTAVFTIGICFAQEGRPAIKEDVKPSSLNQSGQEICLCY